MIAVSCFACVFNDRGQVLCVRRNQSWHLPGGALTSTESLADTVEREVRESSGYIVSPEKIVVAQSNPALGSLILLVRALTVGREPWQPNAQITDSKFFDLKALPEEISMAFGEYVEQSSTGTGVGRIVTL